MFGLVAGEGRMSMELNMSKSRIVLVGSGDTQATLELKNRRVDGIVYGELFIPSYPAKENSRRAQLRKHNLKSVKELAKT